MPRGRRALHTGVLPAAKDLRRPGLGVYSRCEVQSRRAGRIPCVKLDLWTCRWRRSNRARSRAREIQMRC